MKSIIATLIISTLILSLTLMGIELWRNNLEILRVTALKVDKLEKIKKSNLVPLGKDELRGGDVISMIRYYSEDGEVVVEVKINDLEKSYRWESYQQETFYIPFDLTFKKSLIYEGAKLHTISFVSK